MGLWGANWGTELRFFTSFRRKSPVNPETPRSELGKPAMAIPLFPLSPTPPHTHPHTHSWWHAHLGTTDVLGRGTRGIRTWELRVRVKTGTETERAGCTKLGARQGDLSWPGRGCSHGKACCFSAAGLSGRLLIRGALP